MATKTMDKQQELRALVRSAGSEEKRNKRYINNAERRLAYGVIDALRNRLSGPASEGSEYTFKDVSVEACFLKEFNDKLREGKRSIPVKEFKNLLAIARKYNVDPDKLTAKS